MVCDGEPYFKYDASDNGKRYHIPSEKIIKLNNCYTEVNLIPQHLEFTEYIDRLRYQKMLETANQTEMTKVQ